MLRQKGIRRLKTQSGKQQAVNDKALKKLLTAKIHLQDCKTTKTKTGKQDVELETRIFKKAY